MTPPRVINDVWTSAIGQEHRDDPALPRSGGPAGNAQLTAWLGLSLLVLFIGELATLIDVRQLISWHIAIGILLVPPALAKTATTGWRIVRYYTGARPYHQGGPPPLLLRMLGPLVVLTTLALLGTGIAVIALGPTSAFETLFTVAGQRVSVLTMHQGFTVVWAVATGLHVLARFVPALRSATGRMPGPRPDGSAARGVTLVLTIASGVVAALLVLQLTGTWTTSGLHRFRPSDDRPPDSSAAVE